MARRTRAGSPKSIARKKALLDSFVALLNEGVTYSQITPAMITDRLGVTRPVFYFYFKDKSEALIEVIGSLRRELSEHARPFLEGTAPDLQEALIRIIRTNVQIRAQHYFLMRAMFEACVTSQDFRAFYMAELTPYIDLVAERIVQIRATTGHPVSKPHAAEIGRVLVSAIDFHLNIIADRSPSGWKRATEAITTVWLATVFGTT